MDLDVRFLRTGHGRVAYATAGTGPALVLPGWWVSHLEVLWEDPRFRSFVEALAGSRTVVWYDRPGSGLSDRDTSSPPSVAVDVDVLSGVVDEVSAAPVELLGVSSGGAAAAEFTAGRPDRVNRLVLWGTAGHGPDMVPEPARTALPEAVRRHWGLGARMLAAVWFPHADADTLAWFTRYQRAAADADTAADTLAAIYRQDVRDALRAVRRPTLVLHRGRDAAVPIRCGHEVAALVPGAVFRALPGAAHAPWHDDVTPLLTALDAFLGTDAAARYAGPSTPTRADVDPLTGAPALSGREREVLRLVARGLSDGQIAAELVLSPHTVHRHVANIRTKLGQPSRAAAAAAAIRAGLV